MRPLIFYFLESNIYLLIFLATFVLLLRNENNFKIKRFFLLFSIVISLILPLLNIPLSIRFSQAPEIGVDQAIWLPEVIISAGKATSNYFDWFTNTKVWTVLTALYVVGLAIFLTRFCIQLAKVGRLLSTTEKYRWQNCWVVESKESSNIFSFFNFIFIGNAIPLSDKEKLIVLEHEKAHADHLHSLDIILIDLLIILFWFNPLIRLYKKKLIQQHEFEADSRAVKNSEVDDYCSLLARIALGSAGFLLANHFNNSLTIKRITMMQTTKKKVHKIKVAALILIFPAIAFIISCQKEAVKEEEEIQQTQLPNENIVFTVTEQMPEFPGGTEKLSEFLGANLKYPEAGAKKGIEGVVFVSFIVADDGTVRDPKIEKGIDEEFDKEALRVIALSPKWIPAVQNGRKVSLKMTVPIRFKIAEESSVTTGEASSSTGKFRIKTSTAMVKDRKSIIGTILDDNGRPVEGATVVQRGTTIGAVTGASGSFSIVPNSSSGELVIAHDHFAHSIIPF